MQASSKWEERTSVVVSRIFHSLLHSLTHSLKLLEWWCVCACVSCGCLLESSWSTDEQVCAWVSVWVCVCVCEWVSVWVVATATVTTTAVHHTTTQPHSIVTAWCRQWQIASERVNERVSEWVSEWVTCQPKKATSSVQHSCMNSLWPWEWRVACPWSPVWASLSSYTQENLSTRKIFANLLWLLCGMKWDMQSGHHLETLLMVHSIVGYKLFLQVISLIVKACGCLSLRGCFIGSYFTQNPLICSLYIVLSFAQDCL